MSIAIEAGLDPVQTGASFRPRMARKRKARIPRRWRRTKAFIILNLLVWGTVGGWFLLQPAERQREVSRLVMNTVQGDKDITAFEVAWDLWQLYYSRDYVVVEVAGDQRYVFAGTPVVADKKVRLLANTGYVAGYSDALGNPLWVAYRVRDMDTHAVPPRPDEFVVDARTVSRITPAVYTNSGFDRGHLAPNHAIALRHGPKAQEETFLMSNIIPQKHGLNAGLWKALEQKIAGNYPGRFGEVWVIAGPVFGGQPAWLQRRVAVPEACFMILVDESGGRVRASAYLFPQEPPTGDLNDYLVAIDEIERRTGLDFLAELPDAAENALEATRASRAW